MKNIICIYPFFSLLLLPQFVLAESISREEVDALMMECKLFREQQIEPLRQIEIEQCVNDKGKELDYCTRFYKDYGETYTNRNGYVEMGMFWDSPICEQALELERYFKLYPSKQSYQ